MPTYEYECKSCGYIFDAFQSISDEPLKKCPKCGKVIRRLISGGSGIIFKGSGFYITDNGGTGGQTGKHKDHPNTDKTAQSKTVEAKTEKSESAPCSACASAESCPKAAGS